MNTEQEQETLSDLQKKADTLKALIKEERLRTEYADDPEAYRSGLENVSDLERRHFRIRAKIKAMQQQGTK